MFCNCFYYIVSADLKIEMEECIMECVEHGSDDSFAQLLQLILSDHVPINFQHSANGYTGLMAAAMHGNYNICLQLLTFGASTKLWSNDNCSALDFAYMKQRIDCVEILKYFEDYDQSEAAAQAKDNDLTQLLELYHSSISDQVIDFDLLHLLLCHIHRNTFKGSILVFLAGYEDIITVKDRIMSDSRFNMVPYEIFMLHGHMQISDQHKVFNPLPGKRKIILATNIAETSITIDDVVYVIDSGKVKEKCYDAMTGVCSLQCAWISQAGAKQRAGRAGRTQPGICYHIFSKYRYNSMQSFATPEILRMPLHELCLQTKMLAPKETKIADFLARAIEAPSAMAVNSAIKHLQEIDALDENEELTFLGQHLVDLPVEPRLAKMLLYSVIFKCVDPMLTIVAFLSYRDPFVLPSAHQQKMTMQFYFVFFKHGRKHEYRSRKRTEKKVMIHTSSTLRVSDRGLSNVDHAQSVSKIPSDWLIYEELSRSGNIYNMRSITSVTPLTVALFLDNNINNNSVEIEASDSDDEAEEPRITLTDWIVFTGQANVIRVVSAFRDKINCMIRKKITNPYKLFSGHDEALLQVLSTILAKEDTFTGYLQPPGIGQRPKIMMPNHYPPDHSSAANLKQRFAMKKHASAMSEILYLNRITPEHYNKYVPQDLEGDLECVGIPEKAVQENEHSTMAYSSLYNYNTPSYAMNDVSMLNQRFDNMNVSNSDPYCDGLQPHQMNFSNPYYAETLDYFDNNAAGPTDFKDNGTNVEASDTYALNTSSVLDTPFAIKDPFNVDLNFASSSPLAWNPILPYAPEPPAPALNPSSSVVCEPTTQDRPITVHLRNPDCTSFYIIKPSTIKSIEISITKKTWTFSPQIEKKLITVLQTGRDVMLIFTVQGSSCFQGIARLVTGPSIELSHYNHNCPIDWWSRADVTFEEVKGLLNTNFSEGDEIDLHTGIALLSMFINCTPKTPMQLEPTEIPAGRPIKKSSKM
ncbi:RHAU helicase [Carabus blaptoides fortunei]